MDIVSSKIDVTLFIQVRYATNSFKMKNAIYVNVQTDIPRFADIGNEKKGVEEAKNVHIFTGRTVCLETLIKLQMKMLKVMFVLAFHVLFAGTNSQVKEI